MHGGAKALCSPAPFCERPVPVTHQATDPSKDSDDALRLAIDALRWAESTCVTGDKHASASSGPDGDGDRDGDGDGDHAELDDEQDLPEETPLHAEQAPAKLPAEAFRSLPLATLRSSFDRYMPLNTSQRRSAADGQHAVPAIEDGKGDTVLLAGRDDLVGRLVADEFRHHQDQIDPAVGVSIHRMARA